MKPADSFENTGWMMNKSNQTKQMNCGGKVKHAKKMKKGGQATTCRGMGAASRGGKFSRSG